MKDLDCLIGLLRFKDDPETHWLRDEVEEMVCRGYLEERPLHDDSWYEARRGEAMGCIFQCVAMLGVADQAIDRDVLAKAHLKFMRAKSLLKEGDDKKYVVTKAGEAFVRKQVQKMMGDY